MPRMVLLAVIVVGVVIGMSQSTEAGGCYYCENNECTTNNPCGVFTSCAIVNGSCFAWHFDCPSCQGCDFCHSQSEATQAKQAKAKACEEWRAAKAAAKADSTQKPITPGEADQARDQTAQASVRMKH